MKMFYEKDADVDLIKSKKIAIFGYGSQGRAQALNLRDSGNKVLIANQNDKYSKRAIKDKFKINSFKFVAKKSDIIFFLLPDHLHKKMEVFLISHQTLQQVFSAAS